MYEKHFYEDMKMLWVEGYKETTLSQRREDLIVESYSSMN